MHTFIHTYIHRLHTSLINHAQEETFKREKTREVRGSVESQISTLVSGVLKMEGLVKQRGDVSIVDAQNGANASKEEASKMQVLTYVHV